MFKKIALTVLGLLTVLILTLAILPRFYDVNSKIKPLIISTIENQMNVKAEIGKLDLGLLFGVNIGVSSLKITEKETGNVLFEMQDAKLKIPYLSLLTGKIAVTLVSEKPTLRLSRLKNGEINVARLIKSQAKKDVPEASNKPSDSSAASLALGGLAFSASIQEAQVFFRDAISGFDTKIDKLDLKLEDVGINRQFSFRLSTNLNIDNKKDLKLLGTSKLDGQAKIQMSGSGFEGVSLNSELDLGQIEVVLAGLLNKTKETPMNIKLNVDATQEKVLVKLAEALVGKFSLKAEGSVQNPTEGAQLDLKVSSTDLDLSEWKQAIAPLKNFDAAGTASLNLNIKGSVAEPNIDGDLSFRNGAFKISGLRERITQVEALVSLAGQTATIKKAGLKIGESDLSLVGKIEGFSSPKINLNLKSENLNLDKILPKNENKTVGLFYMESASAQDTQVLLTQIRSNPTLAKMDLSLNSNIKKLTVKNAITTDVKADVFFKNLILTVKNASLKAFNGSANAFFQIDLSPILPTFQFNADLKDVDMNTAIVSQFKDLDKFLTGKANGAVLISGQGLEPQQIRKNLKGSGNFFVKEGAWSGAKPLKVIGEKLSKVPKAGDYLSKVNISDRFKEFKADFIIQSGSLNIQRAIMDMEDAKTAMEAAGVIDFDQNINIKGSILAPIKEVPKDLKNKDGRAKIPFEMRGKANQPSVEWERTLAPVAKAYAKDEGKKLLKEGAEKLIKDENVKKLFDKIKF